MRSYPRTWAEIDLSAVAHNIGCVRQKLGTARVDIALVAKADAYGHGLVPVARFACQHGIDWVAVATVQEGIALRDAGIEKPIMVMSPTLPVEADQAVFYQLDIFVEGMVMARHLDAAAAKCSTRARLHLEVDTGIHRFGCDPQLAGRLAKEISGLPHVKLVGIAQHFADSSHDEAFTQKQLTDFRKVLFDCRDQGVTFERIHMANSAGTVGYPESRGNLVRIGILAYGIDPLNLLEGKAMPAMHWYSRVTSIRKLPAGSPIGYCGTWVTERPSLIATVAAGYGDGYPRNLSNRGEVWLNECKAPVVGLVCMDQLLIDVTDVPEVEVGQTVELLGDHIRPPELARVSGTNSHEIVTRIMSRVPRRYLYPA